MPSTRIILGDCRDIIQELGSELDDAIFVSDPPFNIGYHYETYNDKLSQDEYSRLLAQIFGTRDHVMIHYPEALYRHAITLGRAPNRVVSWVYNANVPRQHRDIAFFGVVPDFRKIGQEYKNPNDKRVKKYIEQGKKARLYDYWQINLVKNVSGEKTDHPCQMPLEVMRRVVGILPENRLIVDPFVGSGTTALACKMLNRDFIGIEIDPKYVAISEERLAKEN